MKIKIVCFMITMLVTITNNAAEFNVNTTVDTIDINPGDGICEAIATMGDCSLRGAIIESNAINRQ